MLARLVMLWFLPLAAAVAFGGMRLAQELNRREGRRGLDGPFMLLLAWTPLVYWLLIQITVSDPGHP